jgi:hypothetical protein
MAFSLRLDPKTEAAIARMARLARQTKSAVVREAIAAYECEQASRPSRPKTPFEALAPFIGIADSGGSRRSDDTGRAFRELLMKKVRARRAR